MHRASHYGQLLIKASGPETCSVEERVEHFFYYIDLKSGFEFCPIYIYMYITDRYIRVFF